MGEREMRERIWKDQITLPDDVEKWVVTTLLIQEFCYEKKIPQEKSFGVAMAHSDLKKAFAYLEAARRAKDDPKRYGWRRGDRFMRLASATSLVVFQANQLRELLEEPKFEEFPRKREQPSVGSKLDDQDNGGKT